MACSPSNSMASMARICSAIPSKAGSMTGFARRSTKALEKIASFTGHFAFLNSTKASHGRIHRVAV